MRARRVTAIAAQEYAYVQFVFLALQVLKKPAHPHELLIAFDYDPAMVRAEIRPRHIERNANLLGITLKFCHERLALGFRPRLNSPLVEGFRWIGNHKVQIEVDGVAKTLASRTGTKRIVE